MAANRGRKTLQSVYQINVVKAIMHSYLCDTLMPRYVKVIKVLKQRRFLLLSYEKPEWPRRTDKCRTLKK